MKFEEMLNTITLGDSYELIKDIPDKSVDLVIIDPPYKFTGGGKMTGIFKDRGKRYFDAIEGKGLDNNYDLKILDELLRVLKKINIYIYGATRNNYINILITLKIKIVYLKF